jgi:hypothetical protein
MSLSSYLGCVFKKACGALLLRQNAACLANVPGSTSLRNFTLIFIQGFKCSHAINNAL